MALARKRCDIEVHSDAKNKRFVIGITARDTAITLGLQPDEALHLAGELIEHASVFDRDGAITTVAAATDALIRSRGN